MKIQVRAGPNGRLHFQKVKGLGFRIEDMNLSLGKNWHILSFEVEDQRKELGKVHIIFRWKVKECIILKWWNSSLPFFFPVK